MCIFFYISPLFPQWHCHKPIATNFFFSSYFGNAIATNSLPQVFFFFFPQFRQWHCHKPTGINFFPSYFGNAIATIPFYFFLSKKNMTNQIVLVKKNTEIIKICVLFFISFIYFGNAIATNNNFFFPSYSNSFPHFFLLNFGNGIATNYVLFFVFVYSTLK